MFYLLTMKHLLFLISFARVVICPGLLSLSSGLNDNFSRKSGHKLVIQSRYLFQVQTKDYVSPKKQTKITKML